MAHRRAAGFCNTTKSRTDIKAADPLQATQGARPWQSSGELALCECACASGDKQWGMPVGSHRSVHASYICMYSPAPERVHGPAPVF